jgi:hypothetical protein
MLLGASYAAAKAIPPSGFAHTFGTGVACVPPVILMGALLFVVRGYELDPLRLRIKRLFWHTEVSLVGLREVGYVPGAMKCSYRLFGNGGLFSITGVYENKRLGRYRAFVTNPQYCVVLVLPRRVILVSPENPSAFVQSTLGLFPNATVRESKGDA